MLANATSHAFIEKWGTAQFIPPECEAHFVTSDSACVQMVDYDNTDKDGFNFKVRLLSG